MYAGRRVRAVDEAYTPKKINNCSFVHKNLEKVQLPIVQDKYMVATLVVCVF